MIEISSIPIAAIRFEDVVGFCDRQIPEHLRLEYKQAFSSKNPTRQLVKEVAAFSNTQGGTILYGVQEDGTRRPAPAQQGIDLGTDPRARVLSTCAHNIFPPVSPELSEYLRNPQDKSKGFLVIRVAATDEVHTIDAGTGIYIRTADQSEPVRADLDMIEHLLYRKKRAVDLQAHRRERAMGQTQTALGEGERCTLWVSIGPKILTEPLFDLTELRDLAPNLSVPSFYWKCRSPIDLSFGISGVQDGVYSVDRYGRHAGVMDVFGNVTVAAGDVLKSYDSLEPTYHGEELLKLAPRDSNKKLLGVEARLIVERAIAGLRSAALVCRQVGFTGLMSCKLLFANARGVPLVRETLHDKFAIAACHLDKDIQLRTEFTPSDISTDDGVREVVTPLVTRLIWAWGNVKEDVHELIIEGAEMAHFGHEICPNDNFSRPRNRPLCRNCRQKS